MINFVVVDDNEAMRDIIKNVIAKVTMSLNREIISEYFDSYNPKLDAIIKDTTTRKIYIMDIELQDSISGIQIAKIIRDYDWDSEIIFITAHDKMFESVYHSIYKVFNFIEKFNNFEERLTKDLDLIINKKYDGKVFKYKSRNADLSVFYKNILYIYRDKEERKIVIKTDKNEYHINKNITDIIDELDNRFCIVHRACIVNKQRVQKYDWKNNLFVLDTGESVPLLSKKYKGSIES